MNCKVNNCGQFGIKEAETYDLKLFGITLYLDKKFNMIWDRASFGCLVNLAAFVLVGENMQLAANIPTSTVT